MTRPLLLAGLLAPLLGCSPDRPDLILISLDSVRADTLTFRDEGATPHLARLAREGTIFTQAVTGSSWTLPAHAQMFTGTPPALHGVQNDDIAIEPLTPTLPELVHDAGYFTAGFWTGWYLAGEYGFDRGFDVYENAMTEGDLAEREFGRAHDGDAIDFARRVLGGRERMSHRDITSPTVASKLERTLDRVGDEDLFLFLHLFDPHYDYIPPPPWDTQLDPDYTGDYDGRDFFLNKRIFDAKASPRRRIPDRDLQHLFALYRGEIGWTDAALGEMFDQLEDAGRLENAIIVVTSDHGDEFFEHGGRGHRHSLFDELLRVPLMIRLPERMRARMPATIEAQVDLADLAPTLLQLVGLEVPASMEGRSLAGGLSGEPLDSRALLATLTVSSGDKGAPHLLDALRMPEFKLIRHLGLSPEGSLVTRELAYYDLDRDPREVKPRRDPKDPEIASALRALDAELLRLRQRFDALPRSSDDARATRIREVFEDELGALGYAEAETGSPGLAKPWGLGPHPPPAAPVYDH